MSPSVRKVSAPEDSRIATLLPGAYFHDAWATQPSDARLDALGQFLRVARETPHWIESLMTLRNRVVRLLGLKDLGGLSQIDPTQPSDAYQPGDRVGIFTLLSKTDDEVLLGDDDKHLRVVVSVHRGIENHGSQAVVTVTTVVHVKNWLGRLYMAPVAPAHRVIVRAMVSSMGTHR